MGDIEEESRVVLWTDGVTRCGVVGAGVAQPRNRRHVFEMPKMWQRRMLHGRRLGARSTPLLEEREDKLVWMQREKGTEQRMSRRLERCSKGRESSAAQRGKSTVRRHMVKRTRKHSKRDRERHTHREEKHSKREG